MSRAQTAHSLPRHNCPATLVRRFPEDIECVHRSNSLDRGSIFISNVEAAQNPNTLRSTPNAMQDTTSRQCSPRLAATNSPTIEQ
jgi:hypothetical protein